MQNRNSSVSSSVVDVLAIDVRIRQFKMMWK